MEPLIEAIYAAYPVFKEEASLHPDNGSGFDFMGHFAEFIIRLYEEQKQDELKPAFDIMEEGLASEDEEIRGLIAVGFFEVLQNIASHRPYGKGVFRPYLGERSYRAWEELNTIWEGKSNLAEVLAEQTGASLKAPWWQFWRRRHLSPAEMLEQVENPELRAIIEKMTREP